MKSKADINTGLASINCLTTDVIMSSSQPRAICSITHKTTEVTWWNSGLPRVYGLVLVRKKRRISAVLFLVTQRNER